MIEKEKKCPQKIIKTSPYQMQKDTSGQWKKKLDKQAAEIAIANDQFFLLNSLPFLLIRSWWLKHQRELTASITFVTPRQAQKRYPKPFAVIKRFNLFFSSLSLFAHPWLIVNIDVSSLKWMKALTTCGKKCKQTNWINERAAIVWALWVNKWNPERKFNEASKNQFIDLTKTRNSVTE